MYSRLRIHICHVAGSDRILWHRLSKSFIHLQLQYFKKNAAFNYNSAVVWGFHLWIRMCCSVVIKEAQTFRIEENFKNKGQNCCSDVLTILSLMNSHIFLLLTILMWIISLINPYDITMTSPGLPPQTWQSWWRQNERPFKL